MTTPLLRTKLHIPPVRSDLVPRTRLIERLLSGAGRKLALVSAPAGFGKTTLISQWLATVDIPAAWLQLDDGDNDPTVFWSYVLAAIATVYPQVGSGTLPQPPADQPAALETFLIELLNRVTEPLLLILDDYHAITSPQVSQSLSFFLDSLPPQLQLVLASRADPPWPLGRLRARGEILEVRTDDLRFSPEEAVSFLNDTMKLGLSNEEITALDSRTEGWIAGLKLAALSLQGRDDIHSFITAFSGSHRFILDYLVEEVLDRQPEHIREFLLKTSVLERLSAPLCNAVLEVRDWKLEDGNWRLEDGASPTHAMLEYLESANLFLIPLDDERRWYRYHHLFADLLHSQLQRSAPELIPLLLKRASEWYEQNELIVDAASYALLSGDAERVARLIAGHIPSLMEHSRLDSLLGQIRALPDTDVRSQPWLSVAQAWIETFAGRASTVESLLDQVEQVLVNREDSPERQHLHGYVKAISAVSIWTQGGAEECTQLARQALELLPADDLSMRGQTAMVMALSLYRSADMDAADAAFAEAVEISQEMDPGHTSVMILCNLGAMQRLHGRLRDARDTYLEALRMAEEYARQAGRRLPVSGYAHGYLALMLCEWNDLDAALTQARKGVELYDPWGEPTLSSGGYMALGQVLLSAGRLDEALETAHKSKQAANRVSHSYATRADPLIVLIQLKQGDLAAASRWAAEQKDQLSDYTDVFEYWCGCLTLARVHLAQGEPDQALTLATKILTEVEQAGSGLNVVRALALQAIILQAQGEHEQALATLERALLLAKPEGYVRTFVDEGTPMIPLLRRAVARGIEAEYASEILEVLLSETAETDQQTQRADSLLPEPLSEREMDVLRLLGTGLSTNDIAEQLIISTNTLRTHVKNIYGKLGAHSRTEAVLRAQELGLL
jgi:LuxR family maltose regulon positive regulatory protein